MKKLMIDMDGVLCDYDYQYSKYKELTKKEYPQSTIGFFRDITPIDGAIDATKELIKCGLYDVWILSSPSVKNPHCYSEKREWIEKYFGLDFCNKLILSTNKGLIKGDILVDDLAEGNGKENWSGEFIHFGHGDFPDWDEVLDYLLPF